VDKVIATIVRLTFLAHAVVVTFNNTLMHYNTITISESGTTQHYSLSDA